MVLDPIQGRQAREFIAPNFTSFGPRAFGFPVRSIEVDNPTGQWLLFKESVIRVPPYTINYRVNLNPSAQTIEIRPIPVAGFGGTTVGDQIRLVLRDTEVFPSEGISLTPSQPITSFAVDFDTADVGGSFGHQHITVPATQRIRLYVTSFAYNSAVFTAGLPLIPAQCILTAVTGGEWWYMNINAEQPSVSVEFGPGLDFAPGIDLQYDLFAASPIDCNVMSVYTVI